MFMFMFMLCPPLSPKNIAPPLSINIHEHTISGELRQHWRPAEDGAQQQQHGLRRGKGGRQTSSCTEIILRTGTRKEYDFCGALCNSSLSCFLVCRSVQFKSFHFFSLLLSAIKAILAFRFGTQFNATPFCFVFGPFHSIQTIWFCVHWNANHPCWHCLSHPGNCGVVIV